MARDSIFQYLSSLPDKRTAQALTRVFERWVPNKAAELAGAVQTTMHQVLTAASTLNADADNGKTFYLSSSTEFATTLFAPFLGARLTFIVGAAPSGASYTVVSAASANVIKGLAVNAAGVAGDAGTADDTITFVDGQAVAGDKVDLYSDGTSWFAYGFCAVAAGVTFTQAS
jgi:hypothetical protein